MLGAQVAYLESIAGPAWRVDDNGDGTEIRQYKVGPCVADISAKGGTILALGMAVSPQCTFAVQPFAPNQKLPSANQMKFGDLGGTTYTADCLRSCGNAYDPWVFADWTGSHADNFMEIRVGTAQVSAPVLEATGTWEEAMIAAKGEDWVIMGEFRCSTDFNDVASRAFEAVPVQRVEVGGFPREAPVCEGG
ncbi:MAG: hypothetical protein KY446_03690 [Proteobacteria bacterium]|nr:hypothetical protein [Pseudomonadota bacterium]MBW3616844.1 hypothetical protein [Pseudomonadota bacterium]